MSQDLIETIENGAARLVGVPAVEHHAVAACGKRAAERRGQDTHPFPGTERCRRQQAFTSADERSVGKSAPQQHQPQPDRLTA